MVFEIGVGELPQTLWSFEVLEPVAAEIDQRGIVGQRVGDQLGGGVGHEYLPAMPTGAYPGAADRCHAAVVRLVAQLGLPGVDRHPHLQRDAVEPLFGGERPLGEEGGVDGVARPAERRHDAVPSPCSTGRTPPWATIASSRIW